MAPTTGILDNFNRGSGTGLGADWTALFNRIDLISNEAGGSNNSTNLSFYNPATYGPDCEAYVTITALPADNNGIAVYLRLKDQASLVTLDGYLLAYARRAGTDEVWISRVDNITATQLGATFSVEIAVGDKLLLRAVGDQLTAEHWNGATWTTLGTRTDATYGAAGYLGLSIENTAARADDFGGGTYVPASGDTEEGEGVVNGSTSLTGTAQVEHNGAGQVAGQTTVSGAGEVEVSPYEDGGGQINGSTSLTGSGSVTHIASGSIAGSTSISGAAQLIVSEPEPQEIDDPEMNLLLNIQEFSKLACLDGRVYGVVSRCDTCGLTLNDCVRSHLITALETNQALVERLLGYNLTEHYHEEIHNWDGHSRIQTNWPGVEKVNVRQVISSIPGYGPYPISPFVQENLVLSDSGNGYCVAEVSRTVVENPSHMIIRDSANDIYEMDQVDGYPRRDGFNWLVALAGRPEAPACAATLHAQSCKYMYVDVDEYDCGDDSTLTPVYPGTNTPIPQIKPSEATEGNNIRFWFSPWVLVDPAFYGEEVNLEVGEFYKLLTEIEFKCVQEIAALPLVTAMDFNNCSDDFDEIVTLTTADTRHDLLAQEYGITQVQILNQTFCSNNSAPYKVKIFYKTNPVTFNIDKYLNGIKEAIAYLTAAELPMEVCGCEMRTGFIATAQRAYTQVRVNPVTGENVENLKHGNLYGQLVFAEKIKLVPRFQRSIRL